MRTLVDIPDHQIENLEIISKQEDVSRAEIIRRAINEFVQKRATAEKDVFGLWKNKKDEVDGLHYQETIRSEW